MPRRIKIDDIEELERKYLQGEKSSDFKALIIKLVEKLGSVSEYSKPVASVTITWYSFNLEKLLRNLSGKVMRVSEDIFENMLECSV